MSFIRFHPSHTEIAAFLVSLTKAVNIFRTGVIPPNVNLSTPNPLINWDKHKLRVPMQPVRLPCHADTGRPLISLCSSGIGGANGHVVLEAPPLPSIGSLHTQGQDAEKPLILLSGALSPRSVTDISEMLSDLIMAHPDHSRVISTIYGRRSRQMTWRSFAVYTPGQTGQIKFSDPVLTPRTKPPVVFVFSGQGPQHFDMGRELFRMYPTFRESILEMDQVYTKATGVSLIASTGLFHNETSDTNTVSLGDIWPIEVTLPAIAMLQCALVDLLHSVGVTPDIVVGHSAGETSMLYASNAGSKAMVVELAVARGQAMALVETAGGTMAAISCGVADAHGLIEEALEHQLHGSISVGCHNSHDAVTVSGLTSSIEKVVMLAESKGIMARKLRTRVPVHSSMMNLCRTEFQSQLEGMWSRYPSAVQPQLPVYSTLTGGLLDRAFTSDYYWQGTREPVLFTEAITALLKDHPTATFVEVSPHPVLTSYLSTLGATAVVAPLRRAKRSQDGNVEGITFLQSLGRLAALGYNFVDFSSLNDNPRLHIDLPLPSYPFNTKAVSYHSESASFYRQFQSRNGPLNSPDLRVNSQTHPVLAQHVIKGEPIMPAAGFIEMALEFGATDLWDIDFRAMMSLSGEHPTPVEVKLDGIHWTVKTATTSVSGNKVRSFYCLSDPTIEASLRQSSQFDKIHAEGYLSSRSQKTELSPLNLNDILSRCRRIDLTSTQPCRSWSGPPFIIQRRFL
jgi:acyl transferase domain-containing protein